MGRVSLVNANLARVAQKYMPVTTVKKPEKADLEADKKGEIILDW